MSLTGMDFVRHYEEMLDELDKSMHPQYREIIFRYRFTYPHNLVRQDSQFESRYEMLQHLSTLIWIDHMEGDPVHRN